MDKKRLKWIDMIKGISMILIIFSHSGATEFFQRLYTPIFLTVLFFTSGYTFNKNNNFKTFILNKIRSLVIPLFILGGINAVLASLLNGDNLIFRLKGLLFEVNNGNDDMWFIACLFSCEVIFYFVIKLCKENRKLILSNVIIISAIGMIWIEIIEIRLIWQLELAMVLILYLGMGYLYKGIEEKYKKYVSNKMLIMLFLVYLLSVLVFNNKANIHNENLGNEAFFLISSIIGIAFVVVLCKIIKPIKHIIFIGKNTLVYYAFQSKVIKITYLLIDALNVNKKISPFIVTLLVSLILVLPSIIINEYFPFLIGRKYKNKKIPMKSYI